MKKNVLLLLMLMFSALSAFNPGAHAFELPSLFTLELKREFTNKWSTLALEIVRPDKRPTSEILILSQSVATVWIDGQPAYMVIELYHVHESNMPITIRLYSKHVHLQVNQQKPPSITLAGKPVFPKKAFEFCSTGDIWSGVLATTTIKRFRTAARDERPITVTLPMADGIAIRGVFTTGGFNACYQAGFDWKLHYRPFWEATRLGRFNLESR